MSACPEASALNLPLWVFILLICLFNVYVCFASTCDPSSPLCGDSRGQERAPDPTDLELQPCGQRELNTRLLEEQFNCCDTERRPQALFLSFLVKNILY